jgi:hypothetical protein
MPRRAVVAQKRRLLWLLTIWEGGLLGTLTESVPLDGREPLIVAGVCRKSAANKVVPFAMER